MELCLCKEQLKALFDGPTLCDGPWEGRRGVRGQIRRGADLIKVMASGGVLSRVRTPPRELTYPSLFGDTLVHSSKAVNVGKCDAPLPRIEEKDLSAM